MAIKSKKMKQKTLPNSNIRHSFIELVKKATTFDAAAKINADMFTYVCKCGKIAHFLSKAELAEMAESSVFCENYFLAIIKYNIEGEHSRIC